MPVLAGESRQIATEKYILSTKPVLYVPLWKRDGLIFPSDDGYGYQCTVTSATWGRQGRTFGSNKYLELATETVLNFTSGDFSGSIWFTMSANSADAQYLIERGAWQTSGYSSVVEANTRQVKVFTCQAGAAQATFTASPDFALNTWVNYTFRRSGAVVKIYRNGNDVTVTSGTHINPTTTTNTLKVGVNNAKNYGFCNTTKGELWLYNRALSATEILQIFNATRWRYNI